MPVSFFIDPEMVKDRSARSITQVTLSYTFFPVAEEKRADVSVGKSKVTQ
jgi:cytochrome c oxidase assembly protein subunit 11